MSSKIQITTGARLHFGMLSCAAATRRQFGGVGLMVDSPGCQITFERADHASITGPPESCLRVEEFAGRYCERFSADPPPPCRIEIRNEIPSHLGLGSGTQLGMAVARGLSMIAGEDCDDAVELADRVNRGKRSAVGLHGFARGGLIVEAGKRSASESGALVSRVEFPGGWRLVLARPPDGAGLSGAAELDAFSRLPAMPIAMTGRLCRIVLLDLLPAVIEANFDACGESLYEFGRTVGEYFAPLQGGIYANARMAKLVTALQTEGIRGVGQTSWGPTLFILCSDAISADGLVAHLAADPQWADCRFQITKPRNHGADVRIV